MVDQRDSQVLAHSWELRRRQAPLRAGHLHGAAEFALRSRDSRGVATGVQNPFVERRVMRDQEVGPFYQLAQIGPYFAKRRAVPDVAPGQAVDVCKGELPSRRSDQSITAFGDTSVPNQNRPDGAGAVALVIRSLEVDGNEVCHDLSGGRRTAWTRRIVGSRRSGIRRSQTLPLAITSAWSTGA